MARLTPLDAPAPFELWLVDLGAEPLEGELGSLSPGERERAGRFVFPRDRRRYLSAHVALRSVLSARTGLAAHDLGFVEGPFGKPCLSGASSCAFNLSHSADVAWIATSPDGDIGVDVEALRVVDDAMALAERNFSPAECAALASVPQANRDLAFLQIWTRKEACLKAIGSGLSIAPETFDVGLRPDTRVAQIATPAGVVAVEVHTLGQAPGTVGALARILRQTN